MNKYKRWRVGREWKASNRGGSFHITILGEDGAKVGQAGGGRKFPSPPHDEVRENAELFAAAPETKAQRDDLLEACKGLLGWMRTGQSLVSELSLTNAIRKADAAIEKAEGKS